MNIYIDSYDNPDDPTATGVHERADSMGGNFDLYKLRAQAVLDGDCVGIW